MEYDDAHFPWYTAAWRPPAFSTVCLIRSCWPVWARIWASRVLACRLGCAVLRVEGLTWIGSCPPVTTTSEPTHTSDGERRFVIATGNFVTAPESARVTTLRAPLSPSFAKIAICRLSGDHNGPASIYIPFSPPSYATLGTSSSSGSFQSMPITSGRFARTATAIPTLCAFRRAIGRSGHTGKTGSGQTPWRSRQNHRARSFQG